MDVVATLSIDTLGKPRAVFLWMNIVAFSILAVREVNASFVLTVIK